MNRLILTILFTITTLALSGAYLYHVGLRDGEQNYKHSHRIYMAFKSAYHFGYVDCHNGQPEDWDNGGE